MDDIIKIVGIALVSLVFIILIKQYKPEFALYITLITGCLIFVLVMDKLETIVNMLKQICNKSGLNAKFLNILIKMTGIAYLAEFAISVCKDAGETAIANKLEIGSKAIIIVMSIPIIMNLLEVILKVLQI